MGYTPLRYTGLDQKIVSNSATLSLTGRGSSALDFEMAAMMVVEVKCELRDDVVVLANDMWRPRASHVNVGSRNLAKDSFKPFPDLITRSHTEEKGPYVHVL